MKTTSILVAVFLFAAGVQAQEFVAPVPEERPAEPAPEPQRPSIEGIVAQIFRTNQPWQLINPAAPAAFGSGEKNVSSAEDETSPYFKSKGLIFFGIEW